MKLSNSVFRGLLIQRITIPVKENMQGASRPFLCRYGEAHHTDGMASLLLIGMKSNGQIKLKYFKKIGLHNAVHCRKLICFMFLLIFHTFMGLTLINILSVNILKGFSFCQKFKFSNPYYFSTGWCKPLTFQTQIIYYIIIHG